jgi:hypothetical protein
MPALMRFLDRKFILIPTLLLLAACEIPGGQAPSSGPEKPVASPVSEASLGSGQTGQTGQSGSPFAVEALNFLVQARGAGLPQWLDGASHSPVVDPVVYGGRTPVSRLAAQKPPFEARLEFVVGSKTVLQDRVPFGMSGMHSLFLVGREDGGLGFPPALVDVGGAAQPAQPIRFFHAVPEQAAVDVYLNRKLAAENVTFKELEGIAAPGMAITEITLTLKGKAPAHDAAQDELYMRLDQPLELAGGVQKLLVVYALKPGHTQSGPGHETLLIYRN